MTLVSQLSRQVFVANTSYSLTVPINHPKWIHAHMQLYRVSGDGLAQCGVTQIVSNVKGTENFWPGHGSIWRKDVLTITGHWWAWDGSMSATLIVNYWS